MRTVVPGPTPSWLTGTATCDLGSVSAPAGSFILGFDYVDGAPVGSGSVRLSNISDPSGATVTILPVVLDPNVAALESAYAGPSHGGAEDLTFNYGATAAGCGGGDVVLEP